MYWLFNKIKYVFYFRTPAFVEEDDGDEIFISYKDGKGANEWINKDSHRIKPMNDEWDAKLIKNPM